MSASIVAIAKNENENINEWLSYHKAIGFDKVFLYCNDENVSSLYKTVLPYIEDGFVVFHHHEKKGDQHGAYMHWAHIHRLDSRWVSFLDIDEYITLGKHHSIQEYLWSIDQSTQCIYINWFNFGSSFHNETPQGRILQSYNRRKEIMESVTKILIRTDCLDLMFLMSHPCPIQHGVGYYEWQLNPFNFDSVKSINVDGTKFCLGDEITLERSNYYRSILSISHYYMKNENYFHERAARGLKHYEETGDKGWLLNWQMKIDSGEYLTELLEANEVEDNTLLEWSINRYGKNHNNIYV